MKYLIILGDGMGDLPIPELGGRTPLEAARTPNLDKITPRLISIPVGWWVTKEQREYIVDCIKKGW